MIFRSTFNTAMRRFNDGSYCWRQTPFITFNCNGDEASKALKSKGYDISKAKILGGLNLEDISSESVIDTTINCLVDNKVVRLAAKIYLIFLCFAYGKEKSIAQLFNNFRNFIRYNHVDKPLKFFMSEGGIKTYLASHRKIIL